MTNQNHNFENDDRLTTPDFWDTCYQGREPVPFDDKNWRSYASIQLVRLVESLELKGKRVCEVGGGDAEISAYLARKHKDTEFSVIDFSPLGCALARKRADLEEVKLNIFQADLFSPPQQLLGFFDLVTSYGVVEHFNDLAGVLSAKGKLVNNNGKIFTLIPNFASPLYGGLCKRWSKSVYEDHICHDLKSFLDGHIKAKLKIIKFGYLGTIEFGMLSMAMNGPEKKTWLDSHLYLFLTRMSKLVHLIENKTFDFPTSRLLSPFMYVVSTKEA